MLKYRRKEMEDYPRNFKKDVKNNLGLSVDLRNKQFKELFNRLGGQHATINHLLGRLNEIPKYRATIANRTRQVKVQKKYETKRRETKKKEESAKRIQSFYKIKKEANKLFKVVPQKCWTSHLDYKLNVNPKIVGIDGYTEEEMYKILMANVDLESIGSLTIDDFKKVFHFYKISNFILSKFKENPNGFKLNLGFKIITLIKDGVVEEFKKTMKGKMILTKSDIYQYIDDLFREYEKIREKSYMKIVNIQNVSIIINKTKALNASSYIPLPEWIANKGAIINIKNKDDNNCFIYSVLCGYLDIYQKKNPQELYHYRNHMKELKYDEKSIQ